MLYGRDREQERFRLLLSQARDGHSGALVVAAEPGGGKSALLARAAVLADLDGFQVLRCTGVESEAELPFASLQSLLSSAPEAVEGLLALPQPQADALRGALGLGAAELADRFLVGLATLSLLAELATEGPLLCLIDDAQWLDRSSADALLFAARRLGAESVVMLFAGRPDGFVAPGLDVVVPAPLDAPTAHDLLRNRMPQLSGELRDRVVAEAAGNPLALLELPTMLDLATLPVTPLPLPHRLQTGYQGHIADLPESVRKALLVAAAEETGELGLVLRVLGALGHPNAAEVLAAAEETGMVAVSSQRVEFTHPLKRAAAYQIAPFTHRLAVHAAIANALTDDPDRQAWHRAAAATEPDESIAAALEVAAERARDRTGHATAAATLERAARLTPNQAPRARRLLLAVECAADAGQPDRATRLAREAHPLLEDPVDRARLAGVRARLAFEDGSLRRAHELLVGAAEAVAPRDPNRAAAMLADAIRAAWMAGDVPRVRNAHRQMSQLPADPQWRALCDGLGGGLALHADELPAGVRQLRAHIALGRTDHSNALGLRLTTALEAILIGDAEDAYEILTTLADECRSRGVVGWLPAISCTLATAELQRGQLRAAEVASTEGTRMAIDAGQASRVAQGEANLALVAAMRGDAQRCREFADRVAQRFTGEVNTIDVTRCEWALALLDLGTGRNEAALDRFEGLYRSTNRPLGQWVSLHADHAEAAIRLGEPERAADPLAAIERWVPALDSPWAQALLLRCRGAVHGDSNMFESALRLHTVAARWFDHARTALLYGEWLRRERRKKEARTQLRDAQQTFERLGATPWAERARNELRAAGERGVEESAPMVTAILTPQEYQVVRLAASGATNKEIGAQLFLSPKTVGHHLYRAFPKLGVASRVELARLPLE